MTINCVRKRLMALERKLFYNQLVLPDTANIILKVKLDGYLRMIKQLSQHEPKAIISKMDASVVYKIKKRFGKGVYEKVKKLIRTGEIDCAPSKSECDVYLIQANIMEVNSVIITLDCFNDYNKFWTSSTKIVKFVEINNRFYFNLDLKESIDLLESDSSDSSKCNTSEIDWYNNLTASKGELELHPTEERV